YPSLLLLHYTSTIRHYALSLHDALPISSVLRGTFQRCSAIPAHRAGPSATSPWTPRPAWRARGVAASAEAPTIAAPGESIPALRDRKSTRLNSSHVKISYAVFCLKKKTT